MPRPDEETSDCHDPLVKMEWGGGGIDENTDKVLDAMLEKLGDVQDHAPSTPILAAVGIALALLQLLVCWLMGLLPQLVEYLQIRAFAFGILGALLLPVLGVVSHIMVGEIRKLRRDFHKDLAIIVKYTMPIVKEVSRDAAMACTEELEKTVSKKISGIPGAVKDECFGAMNDSAQRVENVCADLKDHVTGHLGEVKQWFSGGGGGKQHKK
mmetsp:Transcript_24157/g.75126  ORF Transcript_24157/g.75126 Transcript_24157/m.75126 type:complete len:211 (+) Transcript_24157:65-697(+)